MKRKTDMVRYGGFTLVELLTTLAVIAILLGLLIPVLGKISKYANKVKQKGQFNSIEIALEVFRNDYGDYPPSMWSDTVYGNYSASQRLAEAIVGRDGLGFHPDSSFRGDGRTDYDSDGTYEAGEEVYHPTADTTYETAAENLAVRKGLYMELESANVVKVQNIPAVRTPTLNQDSYVLADMYKRVKNTATGKDIGMPILYYRANRMKIGNDPDPGALNNLNWENNTYCLQDSSCAGAGFIEKNWGGGDFSNDLINNATWFYKTITNPNFTDPARPYRAESFLLHSAGEDGLYGTVDDIFNFDQDN